MSCLAVLLDFVSSGGKRARSSYQLKGQEARGPGVLGGVTGGGLQAEMRPAPEGPAVGAPESPGVPSSHVLLVLKGRATSEGQCGPIRRWGHCCLLWALRRGGYGAAPKGTPLSRSLCPGALGPAV